MGCSPSTISRELNRNMRRHDRGRYDAVLAHARSREKARRARAGRIGQDPTLRDLVQDKLTLDWSPEQISFYWSKFMNAGKSIAAQIPQRQSPWDGRGEMK